MAHGSSSMPHAGHSPKPRPFGWCRRRFSAQRQKAKRTGRPSLAGALDDPGLIAIAALCKTRRCYLWGSQVSDPNLKSNKSLRPSVSAASKVSTESARPAWGCCVGLAPGFAEDFRGVLDDPPVESRRRIKAILVESRARGAYVMMQPQTSPSGTLAVGYSGPPPSSRTAD